LGSIPESMVTSWRSQLPGPAFETDHV